MSNLFLNLIYQFIVYQQKLNPHLLVILYENKLCSEKKENQKTLTAFSMIKKSIVKIEAFLDSAKHEQKVLTKKGHDHSSENIKKNINCLKNILHFLKNVFKKNVFFKYFFKTTGSHLSSTS